jgi:hypothetical protein
MSPTMLQADERDAAIVAERMARLDTRDEPRVGDYVRFADGTLRRVSYHWRDDEGWDGGCQTSDGGSFYLGNAGCSFSGSLYSCVPTESLKLTSERLPGPVWIFHHDQHRAHNGVTFMPDFRVYDCPHDPPR